nr:CpsB/CapC family capsule biosynthesis tyrosine phosphatase [uncultured Allomuricauda sp.]
MFSFFQKKIFLADYLHGLVDMHNHILPGIDDGAKTVEESLELIQNFKNLGITNFVFTPHIMNNYYPNTPETIQKSYDALNNALENNNIDGITTDFSAEHMIDDNFETILENRAVMPLKQDYMLVEMSYLQPSINFDKAIIEISKQQYYPILAHPERYVYFHNRSRIYQTLKSQGILFQLNLLSLTSEVYGVGVQKHTQKLLEEGMIDYVASDVHNIHQIRMLKEIKISNTMLNRVLPIIENTIQTFY